MHALYGFGYKSGTVQAWLINQARSSTHGNIKKSSYTVCRIEFPVFSIKKYINTR